MNKLTTILATVAIAAASFTTTAATMSSSITTGHSVSQNHINVKTTGVVVQNGIEINATGGDFSLGNTGWCGRDICSGTDDVAAAGGNLTVEISKIKTNLNETTTGLSTTSSEFCETTFTAGNVTATSGIRTTEVNTNTHTDRHNVTKIKVKGFDYSASQSDDGFGVSVETSRQNLTQVDTGYSTSTSYSETETVYTNFQ